MVLALERSLAVLPEINQPCKPPMIPLHPDMVQVDKEARVEIREGTVLDGVIDHHLGGSYFKLISPEEPPKFRAQLIDAARQNVYQAFVE